MKVKKILPVALITAGASAIYSYRSIKDYSEDILYRLTIEKEDFSDLQSELIEMKNSLNDTLCGHLIRHDQATHTLVILHPFLKDSSYMKKYVHYFEKLLPHTNIVLLDMMSHGMSDGSLRKLDNSLVSDLIQWNDYLLELLDTKMIYFGEGMGANIILDALATQRLEKVSFVISNGAYRNILDYLSYQCFKETYVPEITNKQVLSFLIRRESKQDIRVNDTVKNVERIQTPVIYVHSQNNTDVPYTHVFDLYNHHNGPKELFVIKEDDFTQMNLDNDYSKTLEDFVNSYK